MTFLYTRHIYGISGDVGISLPFETNNEYAILDSVFKVLEDNYIHEVDKAELIDQAAKGMVVGSGDVYATYFTKDEFAEYTKEDQGEYVGIGVLINIGDNNKIGTD